MPFKLIRFTIAATMVAAVTMAHGLTTAIPKGDVVIELDLVCDGLTAPIMATNAGDRSDRLFIVDQAGVVRILDTDDDECLSEPFLDLTDRIVEVNPFFDERGLLGLAFHPRFKQNGRFFVRYSRSREGAEDEPCFGTSRGCHTAVLSEFRGGNRGNSANPNSERVLLEVDEPQFNHDGGHLAFGPDGLLYVALGDGGGANDGLADDPPSHGATGHGQNIETLLGSMLRIDVDRRDPGMRYGIPHDNPFAGDVAGADEIYAYGFRNPYRFSFDDGKVDGKKGDGKLIVADVGQGLFEEVNYVVRGGNYGWVTAEGFHCFDPLANTTPPDSCAGNGPFGEPLLNPVAEYNHGDGTAVIGGYVYRGKESDSLVGKYVFGDFTLGFFPANGRLFWLDTDGVPTDIFEFQIGEYDDPLSRYLLGFGEDEDGELYVLTSTNLGPSGETGEVFRLVGP